MTNRVPELDAMGELSGPADATQVRAAEADQWIDLARAGSTAALDRLIERLSEDLWAELQSRRRRSVGASHGSSDLVQDTLIRVRERFDKFERGGFADFKQWARAILFRRRLEWARNRQNRNTERHKRMIWQALCARDGEATAAGFHEIAVDRREQADRLYRLFQSLKVHEQFIIELRLFNGLPYKQIAGMSGSTEDAARKAYDRAIARLRRQCDDLH